MKLFVVLMLIFALALADSCGGNCPSGGCPNCYCGYSKNIVDIGGWCSKYGWDQGCCRCIVSHESGGNANALNYNSNGSTDVGLWQVNDVNKNLFSLTGTHAVEEMPLVTFKQISTVLLKCINGEEIHGNSGPHKQLADVDYSQIKSYQIIIYRMHKTIQ
jgi:hypothetical protein